MLQYSIKYNAVKPTWIHRLLKLKRFSFSVNVGIVHDLKSEEHFLLLLFSSQTYHKFSFSVSPLTLAHLKMMHKYVVRLTLHVQQNSRMPAVDTDLMKDGICVRLKWICNFSTTIPHRQVDLLYYYLFVKFTAVCCLSFTKKPVIMITMCMLYIS